EGKSWTRMRLGWVAAALTAVTIGLSATPAPASAQPGFGYTDMWSLDPAMLGQARSAGAGAARVYVSWSDIAAVRGRYSWHGAAKAVAPQLPVISGGLSGIGASDSNGMADAAFLSGMYRAGARGAMDGIGYHSYPGNHPLLADLEAGLSRIRRTRNAYHDGR